MGIFNKYPYTDFHELNLDWVIKTCKEVSDKVELLDEWKIQHASEYAELKKLYDQIISGNFPKTVTDAFYRWMQKNAIDLVGELVKNVFFGLTDTGYFVAYIPESWGDIVFNTTGLDISVSDMEYGRLVLSY